MLCQVIRAQRLAEAARQKMKCECAPNPPLVLSARRCHIRCLTHTGIPGEMRVFFTASQLLIIHDLWHSLPNRPQKSHHKRDLALCALTTCQRMKICFQIMRQFSSILVSRSQTRKRFISIHRKAQIFWPHRFYKSFFDVLTENVPGNLLIQYPQQLHFLI